MSEPRPESQPAQQQTPPGVLGQMEPKPDHGEESYRGSGKLTGKAAVITGGDSGIGRAVAIAFAREGADVLISYLDEHDDAKDTAQYVEEAGPACVLVPGDLSDRAHAKTVIPKAVEEFGQVDVLVNNAAFQMTPRLAGGDLRRGVGPHRRHRTSPRCSSSARTPSRTCGRVRHHQLVVGELRHAEPEPGAVRDDQGRDRQLHGAASRSCWPRRASARTASPRAGVDPADPLDHAAGEGGGLRRAGADGTGGPAGRARAGVRAPRERRGLLRLGRPGRGDRRQSDPLSRHACGPPAVQAVHGVHLGQWPTSSRIRTAARLGGRVRPAARLGWRLPARIRRRGGGSCLRDLLFLDAGCCLAESIGCGANLVLLAPTTARHVHEAGSGARSPMTERLIAAVRVYQREISPKRKPCCKYSPSCSNYAVEALETHGARRGAWLTARRLLRCRPGAVGGADPVPEAA